MKRWALCNVKDLGICRRKKTEEVVQHFAKCSGAISEDGAFRVGIVLRVKEGFEDGGCGENLVG